ncbi:hypothetical protein HG536_0A01480 [Torulaspora globosa]|uniref:FHA domain-containing protein n=1 Tax=Torulaspora globosa TaxID=48254 RepID=A0A7G3Z9Z5_9SACH|nr:uncharacterized protein HG536_0A01480 [Torulaspora globosa]QLL30331.1 hypothetical protein HG536_0A01480 [Torulaspora globosa]
MEEVRRFRFTLDEAKSERGVVKLIGRASDVNPDRFARRDNLLFDEKSLSKNHALLGLKLLDPLETGVHIIDQFRIYVKDLGSTYGIVDLNSEESDPFVIDLKNGERFGLIGLEQPISMYQGRAAKLKFQVNLQYHDVDKGIFECIVKDVSFDDSPILSRPSTCEDAASGSSSESNFSEDFTIIREEALGESDIDEVENEETESSSSSYSSDSGTSGRYAIVDLIESDNTPEKWDILQTEKSDDDSDHLCSCSSGTCRLGSKYVIINYGGKAADDGPETNKAAGIVRVFVISALAGFFLGFLGTVVLLVGLALKEME